MSTDLITTLAEKQGLDRANYWNTVKNTVIPGNPSNEHVVAFLAVANQYGLNPLTKEIYAFPSKGGIQPIVSVDGWLKLANKHPQFDGLLTDEVREDGRVIAVRCTIHRKDRGHPVVATEYMEECRKSTEPWKQWPIRMLTNKAMIQAIRRAFSFAGIYDPDEGERIAEAAEAEYHTIDAESTTVADATSSQAEDLKRRLAAEEGSESQPQPENGTADTGADDCKSEPDSPSGDESAPDDFDVMGWGDLVAHAGRVKERMTAGQKKAAAAAVEGESREALVSLFRSMAPEVQS